jgi:hypothetical protein
MGVVSKPYNFSANTTIVSAQVNSDLDTLYAEFNGNIDNANIKSGAAIAASKIANTAATLGDNNTYTGTNTFKKTAQTVVTATDAATVTFDLSQGNIQQVTLGGNRTLALSNVDAGQIFVLRLIQDGTGTRTVTWFSTIKWAGGVTPTLTTTAGKIDIFQFICTSAGNYDGFVVGQNL